MRPKSILLLLMFISAFNLNAQIDNVTFRRISPISGFSLQAIRTIKQDMFGYIWMGTYDGIIRYDSKGIKRFTHNPDQENGLPDDRVTSIVIDKRNNIWVKTDKGICLFNHIAQQFEEVKYSYENGDPASDQINSIELDGDGKLWIADERYFGYLDQEKKQLVRISKGLNDNPIILYNDATNRLWLGTYEGAVYLVLPNDGKVEKKIDSPGSMCRAIFATNSEIWVGYENHGARLYDLNGKLKVLYGSSSELDFDLTTTSIRKILRDTSGRIWIGSYHGLFLNVGSELIYFNKDDNDELPHNSVFDIFEDMHGGIWIGTWAGGVSYVHPSDNKFKNFRHSNEPNSLSNNMVSSFAQTTDGKIFVGTEGKGLNEFNINTNSFRGVKLSKEKKNFNIKTLFVDSKGGFWVGTGFNGLFYRQQGHKDFIHFDQGEEDGGHLSGRGVHSFCESDSGIFIGTNLDGIDFYNFNTQKISFEIKLFPDNQYNNRNIRSLAIDGNDNLWIAAVNGINQYHLPSNRLIPTMANLNSSNVIKNHECYFVAELSDGNIWIGTRRNGIKIYNSITKKTDNFNANGLLEGKDVYGIIEGQNNNIWITSNTGLIQYDNIEKRSRKFIYSDGIQANLFNPEAIFKDRNGNLYFGGTNGFTLLEPNRIKTNNRPPNVFINSIEANNRRIEPTQTAVNKFQMIGLKPNENTLKIDFSTDNYLLPEKNQFKYKLDGYMGEWMDVGNSGSVTLVNVPAGSYILKVKACNNDGIWNETAATLPIFIKQFWYKSDLAIVIYLLLISTILLVFFRFYLERLNLKKTIIIEKIEREHNDQIHEMKLRFFTNISHEFRTPLTLISWPLKKLLESKNMTIEQQDLLETVKRNSNRLLQLINQIMDLRKAEEGQAKLNLSQIELVDFINERMLNFSEEAKSKNIQFSYSHGKNELFIEADEEKLDKVIYNLLSNAFKFTPTNGKINVALQTDQNQKDNYFSNQLSFGKLENEDFVEIIVQDNGEGIDSEYLPNIFDRFEQGKVTKEHKNSTGIGLSLCKNYTLLHRGAIVVQTTLGEGSRFSVRIPVKQKAQKILFQSHKTVKNINSWNTPLTSNVSADSKETDVNILVVEDNNDLRKYIIQFLQNHYSIFSASTGKEGLDILTSKNIHLVISDVMMPVMDGFEFCQTIKSQIETSHIPVILLTALSSADNIGKGLEKGADAYISKPFDESVLLLQIKNLLLQRKRLQESYSQKFISKQPIDIGNLDNYFMNRANAIIEKNIENENFTVDSLASEMGFSRSQLHRKLKQISNFSTSEYITMVKIKRATALLASRNYNIDEVAFKSGFNSHSYFNKCFKKIHSKSPKEFLKQL